MRSRLYLNFWLQPIKSDPAMRYISCRITVEGEGFCEISTGYKIDPKYWHKGRMKETGYREGYMKDRATVINRELALMENRLRDIHYELEKKGEVYAAIDIKQIYKGTGISKKQRYGILEVVDMLIREKFEKIDQTRQNPEGICRETHRTYLNRRDNFELFLKTVYKQKDLNVHQLPEDLGFAFKDYLLHKHYNYQSKKTGIGADAAAKHLSVLFQALQLAKRRRIISEIVVEAVTVSKKSYQNQVKVFLEENERQQLEATVFSDPSLQYVADCFIFAYYSGGLAYTEQFNLNRDEHLVTAVDGKTWMRIVRQKTERHKKLPVSVPLLPQALDILDKYKDHPRCKNGKALPVPSNVEYNRQLKVIAQICGIKKNLTTHVARKTFTTICAENEIPIEQTAAMLGDDIKVVQRHYLSITDRMKLKSMDKIATRLAAGS
jgi:site-specific recombinase XerD